MFLFKICVLCWSFVFLLHAEVKTRKDREGVIMRRKGGAGEGNMEGGREGCDALGS